MEKYKNFNFLKIAKELLKIILIVVMILSLVAFMIQYLKNEKSELRQSEQKREIIIDPPKNSFLQANDKEKKKDEEYQIPKVNEGFTPFGDASNELWNIMKERDEVWAKAEKNIENQKKREKWIRTPDRDITDYLLGDFDVFFRNDGKGEKEKVFSISFYKKKKVIIKTDYLVLTGKWEALSETVLRIEAIGFNFMGNGFFVDEKEVYFEDVTIDFSGLKVPSKWKTRFPYMFVRR